MALPRRTMRPRRRRWRSSRSSSSDVNRILRRQHRSHKFDHKMEESQMSPTQRRAATTTAYIAAETEIVTFCRFAMRANIRYCILLAAQLFRSSREDSSNPEQKKRDPSTAAIQLACEFREVTGTTDPNAARILPHNLAQVVMMTSASGIEICFEINNFLRIFGIAAENRLHFCVKMNSISVE